MPPPKTDSLVKPDMEAVLARTHIGTGLHDFLLPVLEAVSNSVHAIEDRFGSEAASRGSIEIVFTNSRNPRSIGASITDNGLGLNDPNYESFKTPFSGYKLRLKGRGFGRFIAFKVWSRILYSSRYNEGNSDRIRAFRFNVFAAPELKFFDADPDFDHVGTCVEYDDLLPAWHDLVRTLKREDVADEIASHFLPYFLYKWLPKINISFDDEEPVSLNAHFRDIFVETASGDFTCEIDGKNETLQYSLSKIPKTRSFKNHCLLFSAADRIVGSPRDLTNKLGQPHFINEKNEPYIVVAVVRGEVLEKRLNDARTGINITPRSIETIVSSISDIIQNLERQQIDKIKTAQLAELTEALRENPILRLGLRGKSVRDYVVGRPNNWRAEQFISDLAIERSRASRDLAKEISSIAENPDDYVKKIKQIVGRIDENNKEALAEYVIHRRNVIELLQAARKFRDDGGRTPEDAIHDLVFRRFTDNASSSYFEHNLWLVDDVLAFLPYINSDRTMHGGRRQKGDKVADLAFFDDSMVLGDEDGTTLSIIEFKKPSRDDYAFGKDKHDPVLQVIRTLESAEAAGGVVKTDGTHFAFSNVVRRFAFVVADLTPTLVSVLKAHDFKNDWNPRIFVRYRDNERILIQAFGYDTLVENAKKRNQAFFSVLLGE